jgi:ankyrin repeat protein
MAFFIGLMVSSLQAYDVYEAIDSGNVKQVIRMLEQNPDQLNAKNSDAMTPLNLASYRGHADIVARLLQMGADPTIGDNENSQPIHNAAVAGNIDVIAELLKYGVDINSQDANGMTALLFAISYRQFETVDYLLNNNASANTANSRGLTSLHYIAFGEAEDLARKLIAHGADLNAKTFEGETPLHYTVWRNNLEMAELLLKAGADTEIQEDYARTPLHHAARETGSADMASLLIRFGADVNAKDRFGTTPLELAAWRGFSAIVNLLLDNNANVPTTGENGWMLLSYSVKKGLTRLFTLMLDKGADLNISDNKGGTILHLAAYGGSPEIVGTILERGFEINHKDIFGWTPLHYAAERGRLRAVELLLNKGADINIRTLSGHSAHSIADANNRTEVKLLLADHGANTAPREFPNLSGQYMGQTLPGDTPQLFAPDIVSTNRGQHSAIVFSPDGREAYWSSDFMPSDSGYSVGALVGSKIVDGQWFQPNFPEFTEAFVTLDDVPFFAPDGKKLYFISHRPLQPGSRGGKENIWYVENTESGWSDARPVPGEVNRMQMHWQFSVANNGVIYFIGEDPDGYGMGDIYRAELMNGEYTTPQNLGPVINTDKGESCPFIAPDESYILFSSSRHQEQGHEMFIYISFKTKDNHWTKPIKTELMGMCPIVSPDGKYIFNNTTYNGISGIFWRSADFIQRLKPAN